VVNKVGNCRSSRSADELRQALADSTRTLVRAARTASTPRERS